MRAHASNLNVVPVAKISGVTAAPPIDEDPIFALIKLQDEAEAALCAAVKAFGHAEASEDAGLKSICSKFVGETEAYSAATMKRLCNTMPTTPAGIAAVAAHMGKSYECKFSDQRTQKIFVTLAAAARKLEQAT